ncbi:MAG: bifunctional phosphoribosylaminoimidazolecarboxamide formyltransferase/IMP cyclohydrolase, partial [Solirubrobacteraceae bacterium]
TARYDTSVARWFAEKSEDFPPLHVRAYEKVSDLPYGENPHQRAAFYQQVGARMHVLSMVQQHHGKQLSFNNLLDLDAARNLVRDFEQPACVIVKHNNPCGVAIGGADVREVYERAFATDPPSAFGAIVAFNRPVDLATAQKLSDQFVEVLFAPGYEEGALEALTAKPSIRILEDNERRSPLVAEPEIKQVMGGLLVQDRDLGYADRTEMEVVTKRQPSDGEWRDLMFACQVCKHVRSNAIVLARDEATAGIGAGQMSRVDSVRLAVDKSRLESLAGAVLASDAFFPFSDGPQIAIGAGVTAIIQPGGSRRDPEVVKAADAAGIAMVFTSRRHFRH